MTALQHLDNYLATTIYLGFSEVSASKLNYIKNQVVELFVIGISSC